MPDAREPGAGAGQASAGQEIDVAPVIDWLIESAVHELALPALIEDLCQRLHAAGLPLMRVNVSFRVLHPLFRARSLTWRRDRAGMDDGQFLHGDDVRAWQRSPYAYMVEQEELFLRLRTSDAEAVARFRLISELRDAGASEYIACGWDFTPASDNGVLTSWATDRPGGFAEVHLTAIRRLLKSLVLACKAHIYQQIAHNVATTYLGTDPGKRVLSGQIRRGDGETIHAAVLYSDLRGSTGLAESLPSAAFLALLDDYFECTAGAVLAQGGQVLALIGDAVLAIFPTSDRGESGACDAAVIAARDAVARREEVNAKRADAGRPILDFGVGLHVGDVVYGNIGVPERLQFTVIGSTANEVARLESLTKTLGRRVLASDRFAAQVDMAWEHLGEHELRGARQPRAVFALPRG